MNINSDNINVEYFFSKENGKIYIELSMTNESKTSTCYVWKIAYPYNKQYIVHLRKLKNALTEDYLITLYQKSEKLKVRERQAMCINTLNDVQLINGEWKFCGRT